MAIDADSTANDTLVPHAIPTSFSEEISRKSITMFTANAAAVIARRFQCHCQLFDVRQPIIKTTKKGGFRWQRVMRGEHLHRTPHVDEQKHTSI